MAMRATASRFRVLKRAPSYNGTLQFCRPSSGSGRVLSEEERAAENMYMKKMEKEKLEKLATQGEKLEESISKNAVPESPALSRSVATDTSSDANKNVAVAAGVVTLISSCWWFYRANKNVVEEETE